MNYVQLNFNISDENIRDMLLAFLSQMDFDTFEEHKRGLSAFISERKFDEAPVKDILKKDVFSGVGFEKHLVSEQNWNKIWEQNYKPVIIADRCIIKAPFHKIQNRYEFELLIEPQMSFGTAHHETTALMLELMLNIDFNNKAILDIGCGTGILSVFAAMKNAKEIIAIDNNIWAYRNSLHNMKLNRVENIQVIEGDASSIPDQKYDLILANINRNVLLEDIPAYHTTIGNNGKILLSGFLNADYKDIHNLVSQFGYKQVNKLLKNDWVAVEFSK